MSEILTAAQMRAIEQAAIDTGSVTGLELMERAGRSVVEAIFEEWPEMAKAPHSAVVLCGPGNNGGDGFVVARLLKERAWEVELFLYGDPDNLPPDARANYARWCKMGDVLDIFDETPPRAATMSSTDEGVLIDALFGTGLTRPIEEKLLRRFTRFLSVIPLSFLKSVAVDVPSGFCSDSGKWLVDAEGHGTHWCFELVVTFHRSKTGHVLAEADGVIRSLRVKPIGLDEIASVARDRETKRLLATLVSLDRVESAKLLLTSEGSEGVPENPWVSRACWSPEIDKAETGRGQHKYSYGHALILSGPMGRSGAARLAARGALRVGAGLVTVGAPGSAMMECATQLTAIMLRRCRDAEELSALLLDDRLNALCLGPGLGVGEKTRALVAAALAAGRATVLDADALTSFAENPQDLFDLLHPETVLTPHGGEFARLFPDIAETLAAPATKGPAYSKVDATREAAARAGCVVLFKGHDTVIASPDGRCAINAAVYARSAPWLATAGSGDVLAGIITGLLARGFEPQLAAETGAWLHVEAARAFGPGLIAEDLPEMLPRVFQELGF